MHIATASVNYKRRFDRRARPESNLSQKLSTSVTCAVTEATQVARAARHHSDTRTDGIAQRETDFGRGHRLRAGASD